ncbi:hypothetical protein BDV23DRAFT_133164 [Aspergillus alliaceus]|uniref:Uncharacterized protein n=1 Tax=Petromyces alliaceus TaxID=209559 RepID=A0A5N7BYJ7_PETAA|nr:hypothetical protein BDV23DRAFT_133164 [Aspergillus alliaceus]
MMSSNAIGITTPCTLLIIDKVATCSRRDTGASHRAGLCANDTARIAGDLASKPATGQDSGQSAAGKCRSPPGNAICQQLHLKGTNAKVAGGRNIDPERPIDRAEATCRSVDSWVGDHQRIPLLF